MDKEKNKNVIKVLHIVGSMYPGGMENFVMNVYENINKDIFHFDFAENVVKENGYDERIKELGGKVFVLPRLTKHPIKNLRMLGELVKREQYDIVVRHTSNALIAPQLWAAKKAGAITVCHSHSTTDPMKLIHYIGKFFLRFWADKCIACSLDAGKWMYGSRKFTVLKNGIDISKFSFDEKKKSDIYEEFNLYGKHVYGHIGNYLEVKNHTFLLDVFNELLKIDENAVLFCLGEGNLRPDIEKKISALGLESKVYLTGMRKDADKFMSAFDVLIFPSIFEGLPLTLIEAQISGLKILMSDTITDDVIVTDGLVHKESLNNSALMWAKAAYEYKQHNNNRECQIDNIRKCGYDLKQLVCDYENFLSSILK